VSGSVSQRSAQAQVPGMGGALGSVAELGSSIVEMQQHGDGLQKNLATLKKVQAALGGGKESSDVPGAARLGGVWGHVRQPLCLDLLGSVANVEREQEHLGDHSP